MGINSDAIKELNIDFENKLFDLLNKSEMERIFKNLTPKKNKREITTLMCDSNYFSLEELFYALDKTNKQFVMKLLDEPKNEKDMAPPIIAEIRKKKYKLGREVPLPKVGRGKPRKMDVAGYKKGMLGGISIIGFELKSQITRGAIDKAISQARDYQDYCEQVYVCFSPLLYASYSEVIKKKLKKENTLGAWVVGTKQIHLELQDAYATQISDKNQKAMVKYIDSGKTS